MQITCNQRYHSSGNKYRGRGRSQEECDNCYKAEFKISRMMRHWFSHRACRGPLLVGPSGTMTNGALVRSPNFFGRLRNSKYHPLTTKTPKFQGKWSQVNTGVAHQAYWNVRRCYKMIQHLHCTWLSTELLAHLSYSLFDFDVCHRPTIRDHVCLSAGWLVCPSGKR